MTLSSLFRPAAVLALALALTACGGKASFPIKGTVVNLLYPNLVLSTNGMDLSVPAKAPTFSFPNTISYGDIYAITVSKQPDHQTCDTTDRTTGLNTASDTAGRTAAINIVITCVTNTFTIGGDVSGLTTDGLVLTNGSTGGTVTVVKPTAPATTTSYIFSTPVTYGVAYGVTVLTQPTGATCTVSNPTGVMGDANISNINVSCVANPTTT